MRLLLKQGTYKNSTMNYYAETAGPININAELARLTVILESTTFVTTQETLSYGTGIQTYRLHDFACK